MVHRTDEDIAEVTLRLLNRSHSYEVAHGDSLLMAEARKLLLDLVEERRERLAATVSERHEHT